MPDHADERVIAEWLRKDLRLRFQCSEDANLWPGIMELVYSDARLADDFERRLEFSVVGIASSERHPYYRQLAAIKIGPEAWTHALAEAIRKMKGGG